MPDTIANNSEIVGLWILVFYCFILSQFLHLPSLHGWLLAVLMLLTSSFSPRSIHHQPIKSPKLKIWEISLSSSFFLEPRQHVEVPRLRSNLSYSCQPTPQPQQQQDPSRACNLHHSPWQRRILDPLSKAGVEPETSWFLVGFISAVPRRELQSSSSLWILACIFSLNHDEFANFFILHIFKLPFLCLKTSSIAWVIKTVSEFLVFFWDHDPCNNLVKPIALFP